MIHHILSMVKESVLKAHLDVAFGVSLVIDATGITLNRLKNLLIS